MTTAASQIQTGTLEFMGAPGFRFIKELWPLSREGGLNYYPYSALKSGLTPSWSLSTGAPTASPASVTVAISAGTAMLDSQDANLSSPVNITFTPQSVVGGSNYFRIFLNPTRKLQPVVASSGVYTPPTTRLNGDAVMDGDKYCEAVDFVNHLEAQNFFKLDGGVWVAFDPSFESIDSPAQRGQNRVFGNATHKKVTLDNFTINAIEAPIYMASAFPVYGYRPARAQIRRAASLEVVTAELYYHVLPLEVEAAFTNGSTSVTLSLPFRATMADVVASITNTNTLTLDGQALAASGYNSTTGVVTLASAYAGSSETKTALLEPGTPGANYILSPALSELVPTTNLTNP